MTYMIQYMIFEAFLLLICCLFEKWHFWIVCPNVLESFIYSYCYFFHLSCFKYYRITVLFISDQCYAFAELFVCPPRCQDIVCMFWINSCKNIIILFHEYILNLSSYIKLSTLSCFFRVVALSDIISFQWLLLLM